MTDRIKSFEDAEKAIEDRIARIERNRGELIDLYRKKCDNPNLIKEHDNDIWQQANIAITELKRALDILRELEANNAFLMKSVDGKPTQRITNIVEMKQAIAIEFGNRWIYPYEYEGEGYNALAKAVNERICDFEAGVRAEFDKLDKEFKSKYRLGVKIPVIERHRLTLIHGEMKGLRRVLSGSEIPKKGLEGEKT